MRTTGSSTSSPTRSGTSRSRTASSSRCGSTSTARARRSRASPRADADAYRRLIAEYDEVKGIFGRGARHAAGLRPVARGAAARAPARADLAAAQRDHGLGRDPARVRGPPRAGVHDLAGVPDARAAWTPRAPGVNAYSIIFGRQGRSWSVPRGGSGALTDALTRFLEDHGSTVLCNRQVSQPRPRGRPLHRRRDGRRRALHGERARCSRRSTSSSSWRWRPREAWGEEFVYGVETYDVGMSGMACYLATDAAPRVPDAGRAARGRLGRDRRLAGGRARARAGRARPAPVRRRACRGCSWPRRRSWIRTARPAGITRSSCSARRPGTCRRASASWEEHKETIFRRQLEHVRRFIPALSDEHILDALREEPGGHRALEPAHDPRRVPRRRPQLSVQRQEPARARAGRTTACRSPGSTRRAARRAWAARSPACRAATPRW